MRGAIQRKALSKRAQNKSKGTAVSIAPHEITGLAAARATLHDCCAVKEKSWRAVSRTTRAEPSMRYDAGIAGRS